MVGFDQFPKQFLISEHVYPQVAGGKRMVFGGYGIQAADELPFVRLKDALGSLTGLLIGWVIYGDKLLADQSELEVPDDVASLFPVLSGRFACIWAQGARIRFGLDPSGGLPAVFDESRRVIASTPTLIGSLHDLEVNYEVQQIFQFPKRRGFLPFGLTNFRGVRRLLPNHIIDLNDWSCWRVWPTADWCNEARRPNADVQMIVSEVASVVTAHVEAIIRGGRGILYLSGGHDSRMVLAACRKFKRQLTCETLFHRHDLDVEIAQKVTNVAGIQHLLTKIVPTPRQDVSAWLYRTGFTFYDPLTELAETVRIHDRNYHVMDGTGAEITRATNWYESDLHDELLGLDTLISRIRMPDADVVRAAASAWLSDLPPMDAAMALDVAKIEQIHGCWASVGVYGHMNSYPSLSPFSDLRIHELALRLPKAYKYNGAFFGDYMNHLWPDLLRIPVNRASGLRRLRFARQELRRIVPKRVKRWIKPLR